MSSDMSGTTPGEEGFQDGPEVNFTLSVPTISAPTISSTPALSAPKMSTPVLKSSVKVVSSVGIAKSTKSIDKASSSRVILKSRCAPLPTYTKSDSSVYPTYSHLRLPDRVICRQRYQTAIFMHHEQFIKEIKLHERLQPYALGGVRLRREFCDPILVKVSNKDLITLSIDEERRLEFILKTDPAAL